MKHNQREVRDNVDATSVAELLSPYERRFKREVWETPFEGIFNTYGAFSTVGRATDRVLYGILTLSNEYY
jgi:hypothetical protein